MIVDAKPGWTSEIPALPPGTIVALFSEDAEASIEGRLAGFKMVDTLLVLGPFTTRFAFMMRTPFSGGLVQSASDHNTGVLNIAASRTPDGRWPPNVVLVHHPACSEAAGDWQCVDACLVKHVDNLSGERKAGGAISTAKQGPAAGSYHGHGSGAAPWAGYGDHGSASRFYPQFSGDEGLLVWLSSLLSLSDGQGSTVCNYT